MAWQRESTAILPQQSGLKCCSTRGPKSAAPVGLSQPEPL